MATASGSIKEGKAGRTTLSMRSKSRALDEKKHDGSHVIQKNVPGALLFILGTAPGHRGLLWHGGYCHACVLPADHNLRSNARIPGEQAQERAPRVMLISPAQVIE